MREVMSAEVKIDSSATTAVVAFGQAVAYRLFSHKVYIVMPRSPKEDGRYDRLEALCALFGVGMVIFDLDLKNPRWENRVQARAFPPDMYWVNQFAERLADHKPEVFKLIFE